LIITHVALQDYGVYRGRNEFNFTCNEKKPIVLIGGTNGAGKTTLFESIMLCLYGISTMKKATTKKEYKKFLARKIHRYMKSHTRADHASITVQFKFFHNGREVEYMVERAWRMEDGDIKEQLTVGKRDTIHDKFSPLDTIERSYWQSFVDDLIPRGIVKLFFFDGEKIVGIARDGTENITIQESFKSLLGIDIVEQLHNDLQVNLTRNLTKGSRSLQQDFEKLKGEKNETMETVTKLQERLAQKQTEMDSINISIEALESKVSRIGGSFVRGREDAKSRRVEKRLAYNSIHDKIMEMCSDVLPFAMIPVEMERLVNQLKTDHKIQQHMAEQRFLDSKIRAIHNKITSLKVWNTLDADTVEKATSEIMALLDEQKRGSTANRPIYDLSATQAAKIAGITKRANTTMMEELKGATENMIMLGEEIDRLDSSITKSPHDDEIGSLLSEIGQVRVQQGALQAEMDHIEEKISSNMSFVRHIDVKIRDIVSQIYKNEKSQRLVQLTQNVQTVLEEFIEQLRIKKIRLLEQYLLEAVQALMHKKDLIGEVAVDYETFEVTLFRKNGEAFPKDLLSEGEKQMFAMAVLWALARTSGRPLPFMIDTPLARLDEGHRSNIIVKFLPAASHQILIFSTDTEIEYKEFKRLIPHMTRSYAMEYDEEDGITRKHDGYFWNMEGQRIAAIQ